MSNYTTSTDPSPTPIFNDWTPCMADLICDGLSPSVIHDSCLPAVQYLVENHPDDSYAPDTCLRTCSKFLRTDLDSITHINSLLPRGWSLMAAPSPASTVHRRRQEKRHIEALNEQCKALLLKVQKRFMNQDGSNGSVTMMFLHLLNNTSDRDDLRRNVRALFQWHPDLCHDFDVIFCPANIIDVHREDAAEELSSFSQFDPFGAEVETTPDGDESAAVIFRTPSPIPSLTLSGDRSSASSMSPPSRLPTTPNPSSHASQVKVGVHSSYSPEESWMSSFVFTPENTSSSAGIGLGLVNRDGVFIDTTPTPSPVTAASLMDRHLASARSLSISNLKACAANHPPTAISSTSARQDAPIHPPLTTPTLLFDRSEYNPSILPTFASLDKDIYTDALSLPSFLLEEQQPIPTTDTQSNSRNSVYEPVLYPFGVTHGRVVQFDSDSWSASTPISKTGRAKKTKGGKRQTSGHVEGRSAKATTSFRSVRGVESWMDVTVPRAAAAWKPSPYGAVGDGRPKPASERKAPAM